MAARRKGGVKAAARRPAAESPPVLLTSRVLRQWPLPPPEQGGDKEERGRVLVVGGSAEMPGALILAATAALRAGAGKLRIAAPRAIAPLVAAAVPEARVFALPETRAGAIAASSAAAIAAQSEKVQAVLIGPGLIDETAVAGLMRRLLPRLKRTPIVLDAVALSFLADRPQALSGLGGRVVLTPHAEEMSEILGTSKASVRRDPLGLARRAASGLRAVIALKGAETFVVSPEGRAYLNRAGNVGLATSGSGDVLAGVIAGLIARGAALPQAAAWAVALHGRAGDHLARKVGPLGFLARELPAEIPALMAEIGRR